MLSITTNLLEGETGSVTGLYTNDAGAIGISSFEQTFSGNFSEVPIGLGPPDHPYMFGVIIWLVTLDTAKPSLVKTISNNNNAPKIAVPATSYVIETAQIAFPQGDAPGYQMYPVGTGTEFATLLENFTRFRTSAESAWLSYTQGIVVDGKVSCCVIKDGSNPFVDIDITEQLINSVPGSYSGKMSEGSYQIYKPLDIDDLEFKEVDDDALFRSSYFIIRLVGSVSPGLGPAARLRVCAAYEAITSSQLWFPLEARPDFNEEIARVLMEIDSWPDSMENKTHLAKIAKKFVDLTRKIIKNPLVDYALDIAPMPPLGRLAFESVKRAL